MQEVLTRADEAATLRARAARLVLSPLFQRVVIGLILFNAVTLGLETSESVMEDWGGLLHAIDTALLALFTVELAIRIYAFGGFNNQNRGADTLAFAYDIAADRWSPIAPMPRPRGAGALAVVDGKIHHIGGASEPETERASVGWHEVYDPQTDRWERRKALPGARDHAGVVVWNGNIHIVGGRFNTFEYNTSLHHMYIPAQDQWVVRAPLPTARSGHGLVIYRNRFFAMGGESGEFVNRVLTGQVHGQMESYDPQTDRWQAHAPMPTPRHAVAAVTVGDWIYVAGGGAVLGGGV
jgi:N-acetylneuraminic acid mutarotase